MSAVKLIVALVAGAIFAWANLYEYTTAGGHGIYRSNRVTHETMFSYGGKDWKSVKEGEKVEKPDKAALAVPAYQDNEASNPFQAILDEPDNAFR